VQHGFAAVGIQFEHHAATVQVLVGFVSAIGSCAVKVPAGIAIKRRIRRCAMREVLKAIEDRKGLLLGATGAESASEHEKQAVSLPHDPYLRGKPIFKP
jgi:hypothetical protein